jgi:hypothetical protein
LVPEEERRDGYEQRGRTQQPQRPDDTRSSRVRSQIAILSRHLSCAFGGVPSGGLQSHRLYGRHVAAMIDVTAETIPVIERRFWRWLSFGIHMPASCCQQGPYQ